MTASAARDLWPTEATRVRSGDRGSRFGRRKRTSCQVRRHDGQTDRHILPQSE